MWLQNVLHVELGVQAAWNFHKLAPASGSDGPPHHHASTTMRRRLIYALMEVALSLPPVHPPPAVVMLQEEMRLIAEDNVAPVVGKVPLEVLVCPLHPGLAMAASKDVAPEWPVGVKTSCMQAVPDGLRGDVAVTRQCPSGHRG